MFEKATGQPQLIQHLKAYSFNLSSVFPWGIKARPLGRIMSRKGDECVNHKLEDLASRSVSGHLLSPIEDFLCEKP